MTEQINLLPKRRFKEFQNTHAWEQRKLKDIAEFNPKSALPDSFEYVDLESVVGTDLVSHRTELKSSAPSRAQRLAIRGDVFYQTVRPYQMNNYLFDLSYNNYVFSTGYAQIRPNIDSHFLFSRLQEERFVKEVLDRCTGTSYPAINSNDLSEIEIRVPCDKEEQIRIGVTFKNLDHLITLHQRKREKIKALKSAYLSEMFPSEGESEPKRRFAGFTQAWEQRTFSVVLEYSVSNNTLSRARLNYDKGEIKNIHYGEILVKFDSIVDVNSDDVPYVTDGKPEDYKSQLLRNGDVIIADTAEDETTGKAIEITGITDNYAVSGLHTMVARPNIEFAPMYLGYYLNSPSYHNQLLKLMQGIKVLSLSKANVAKTTVAFPKDTDEQAKIGSFFANLDHLITLHQRKLEKLQNIKKAYLHEMFI